MGEAVAEVCRKVNSTGAVLEAWASAGRVIDKLQELGAAVRANELNATADWDRELLGLIFYGIDFASRKGANRRRAV